MRNIGVQRYARRLRKILLDGVDVGSILELYENHEKAMKSFAKHRREICGNASEKFAYDFCKKLDILDKRFLNYEKKITDNFRWTKFYEKFQRHVRENCKISDAESIRSHFLNLAPPWFQNENLNLSYGAITQKAILGLRFYLNPKSLNPLLENYRFLEDYQRGVQVLYLPGNYWLKYRKKGEETEVNLSHSFGTLSIKKTEELMVQILNRRTKISNEFLNEEAYLNASRELKNYDRAFADGKGIYRDADRITRRVLERYFPEMKTRPRVFWFDQFSARKLAHYDSSRDEIGYSLIFDHPEADETQLEFLAFHELIHRKLGVEITPDRIFAHTGEFRKMERSFPNFSAVDQALNRYASGHFIDVK